MHTQMELPLDRIAFNPNQPRKAIDPDELATLCASIKTHGILQPLVVRQMGNQFQLIAGERRLRAARDAGLNKVPVQVVDFNDQETMEAALVENIQRSDLNAIEKAQGFKEYLDRFNLTHEQLAQRLGLARTTITNLVQLLELAPEVQNALRTNQISEGHGKLLKGVKDQQQQVALYKQIVAQGLSVKATDAVIRQLREVPQVAETEVDEEAKAAKVEKTAHVKGLEDELKQQLATHVEIKLRDKDKGQIIVRFDSNDDFLRILERLRGQAA